MFSLQIGSTPTQNVINELKIKNTIGDPEPVVTQNLTFTNPDYNNSTLDCYEEYKSPYSVQFKQTSIVVNTQSIVIVNCGRLVTLCYNGFYNLSLPGSGPFIATNAIPTRFLPGILLNGVGTTISFPIIINDQNNKKIGCLTIDNNGTMTIYAGLNNDIFEIEGGIISSYVSWVR